MIKKNSLYTFIILLTLAISVPVLAQETTLPEVEKVALFPDRSIYIAGENICFSAFIRQSRDKQPLSRILYVELIANDGKSISRGKFKADNFASDGCLFIPHEIITGVYFVKAYTKYMRNAGVYAYAYKAIRIINPYRDEVVPGDKTLPFKAVGGLLENDSTDKVDSLSYGKSTPEIEISDNLPEIITNRSSYSPGEQVKVNLKYKTEFKDIRLSLSVVPEVSASTFAPELKQPGRAVSSIIFYPETRGLTISGVMREAQSNNPASYKVVNLSIIGKGRDFIPVNTDKDGRYLFALPSLMGLRDIYIGTAGSAGNKFKLLVDNDFCSLPIELPAVKFILTDAERAAVYKMALNATIEKSFNKEEIEHFNIDENDIRAFYGSPVHTLLLNDYVQLPNLEEYFNELPGMIKVRKKAGKKYFKVIGNQPEMVTNDPLVMIDLVAVDDPEKVLAATPSSILRIEMINEPYLKGNIIYGGIISIISKKGDFGGVDLPASGSFINYLFLSDSIPEAMNVTPSKNIPDTRNTIHRISDITGDDEIMSFSFPAPATIGKYAIVINGMMKDGSESSKATSFEVKN